MDADAQGVHGDAQVLRQGLAAPDMVVFLVVAQDEPALVLGERAEAVPERTRRRPWTRPDAATPDRVPRSVARRAGPDDERLCTGDGIHPAARDAAEAAKKIGVTEQTYYRWRKEYGGLRTDQAKRLKERRARSRMRP